MQELFDNVEVVSNGFIASANLSVLPLSSSLQQKGYLSTYKLEGKFYPLNVQMLGHLIIDCGLSEEEQEQIKTDISGSTIYIFTTSDETAQKLDSVINLLNQDLYLDNILASSSIKLYTECDINNIIENDYPIRWNGERIGQLEWLDYATYAIANNDYLQAITAYCKYYKATADLDVGFNLATALSSVNADHLALLIYYQLRARDYDCNHNIVLSHYKLKQYRQALTAFEAIDCKISPKSYILGSYVYVALNRYQDAIAIINEGFIKLKKTNPDLAQELKRQFIRINQFMNQKMIKYVIDFKYICNCNSK